MGLTNNILQREYKKFELTPDDETAVRVISYSISSLVPEKRDYIGVTYPDDTTEVYTYKLGGASGTTVATVTVVYTTECKEHILSVTRT